MKDTPVVSVVLPNYNHSLFLKERIESILNQTYQNFEVILLDDCSTDSSKDILLLYKDHPKVSSLVLNERNTGNTFFQWDKGIRLAKGKYIWIAESDDCADVHFLEMTVAALEQNPDATMCLTGSVLIDEHSHRMKRKSRDRWKETGEVRKFEGQEYAKHNLLYRNYVYNASMVVFRRNVYDKLDKSFQQLRCGGDWQFWVEVAQEGNVIEIRKKMNYFRQHSNKVSNRAKQTGEGGADVIEVMQYVILHTRISTYKRWIVLGECYRTIKKMPVSSKIRLQLYEKAYNKLGVSVIYYWLERINRVLSFVIPFLPTHRRDKLK
ncbi:glycosyltransferase family 2 protein [Bacteroides sp.]|uniref:glycosyltransferase family 2 protein n=1 Tax=Bacteroides sp. TaxID=29523 RepID=UPI003AB4F06A